jgi:eukaryotic-like serine/threonine-protein kinase
MSAPPLTAPSAAADRRIGGYAIVRLLGDGGLGSVYLATDSLGRPVALKTFNLHGDADGRIAETFRRETVVGQQIEHDGIVRILDAGFDGHIAFLALEYVPGHDLQRHTLPAALLPLPQVLHVVQRVALALAAAHARHIVHRDIKPSNVLVHWPTNTVKVTDFGLARISDMFRSRTGLLSGTPVYMSPEQLAEGRVDARSDLYALGTVMFHLLVGRLPFQSGSLGDLLRQVATVQPPPISAFRADLPAAVIQLVTDLIQKDPDARPPSAQAVHDRVAQAAQELGTPRAPAAGAGPMSRAT